MSLQIQSNKHQTQKTIKSTNYDLSILNNLSKPSTISPTINLKPKSSTLSLNNLASILVNKNKKFTQNKQQQKQVIQWLKYKGVDWNKINQQVKTNALLAQQQAQITKQKVIEQKGLESITGIKAKFGLLPEKRPLITQQMQNELILKNKDAILCKIVQNSLRKPKGRNNTTAVLFNKIRGQTGEFYGEFNLQRQLYEAQQHKTQRKNIDVLKNQYFDFVKSLSANGFDSSLHFLKKIRPFWRIVLQHVTAVQSYVPILREEGITNEQDAFYQPSEKVSEYNLKMNQRIMLKSLKLVERQFEKNLPDMSYSFDKLDEIVRDMERRNHRLRVWRNSNGEATWALVFLLLKAGRINQIKRVLQSVDRQILSSIVQQSESINSHKPEKSHKLHDGHKYNDTFYAQIIRIIEGSAKFDPLVLNNEPLTRVWLLLRTIGIYRGVSQINDQFNRINEQLVNAECQSTQQIDENKIQQFMYLGNYKYFIYLAEMIVQNRLTNKANQYFTYHDYFHLLTVVNYFPQLYGNSRGRQLDTLQGKFTQTLVQYMQRLRIEKHKIQLPSYLLLSSHQKLNQVVSKFITKPSQYRQFDWKSLRQLLQNRSPSNDSKLSQTISKKALDSLTLSNFDDFLFAASIYRIDFPQFQDSLYREQKCYTKLLLGYLYFFEKKKQLLKSNLPMQQFQTQMFSFFNMSQQQNDRNILMRREKQIRQKVKDCEEKLQVELIRKSNDQEYIANASLPYAFYKKFSELSKLMQNPPQKIPQLKRFNPKWSDLLSESQRHKFSQGLQLVFLRFLGFEYDRSNYSALYVYYLNEVVQRKKFICSIESDYTGVMNQLRTVGSCLQNLQRYYKKKGEEFRSRERKLSGQQRQRVIQQSTNPLRNCIEYQRLKQAISQLIGEQIGYDSMRQDYGSSTSERRRASQYRNQNEYFRQQAGY